MDPEELSEFLVNWQREIAVGCYHNEHGGEHGGASTARRSGEERELRPVAGTKRSDMVVVEEEEASKLCLLSAAEEACEATPLFVLPGGGKAVSQRSVRWLLWRPGLSDGGGEEEEVMSSVPTASCQSDGLVDTLIADLVRHTDLCLSFGTVPLFLSARIR